MNIKKALSASAILTLIIALAALIWLKTSTYAPAPIEPLAVTCADDAPTLKVGQKLKVLSWNVQYMASKNYFFYYDAFESNGPDLRPSAADIAQTIDEVARVIIEEDPDVVLLQEVDQGAKRTDYQDQAELLRQRLPKSYACHNSTPYWRASFVPHPKIMGEVNMAMTILSKYRIDPDGQRHALPMHTQDWLTDHFYLKRAIQHLTMPIQGDKPAKLHILNTHLDAFAQGSDTMAQQVGAVYQLLQQLSAEEQPFILGGDFNLLATPQAYAQLNPLAQRYYNPTTEITPLLVRYQATPQAADIDGPEAAKWFTHIPNDPRLKGPDRTIDYIFTPKWLPLFERHVRQHDTLKISDHLPVVVTITAPAATQ